MKRIALSMLITLNFVVLGIGPVLAGEVGDLNRFQAGTRAIAEEVNDNFEDIKTAVNGNDDKIKINTADISTNIAGISANADQITTNTANISTNIADISANADDISNNASDIATLPRLGDNLPRGSTIRGFFGLGWTADAAGEFHETYVAFGFTLASAPKAHFIPRGSTPPAGCPGSSTDPQADPGHICFYEDNTGNTSSKYVCSSFNCPGATRWGIQYRASSEAAGSAWTRGTWAVTAP
jgi:hypothetical protein